MIENSIFGYKIIIDDSLTEEIDKKPVTWYEKILALDSSKKILSWNPCNTTVKIKVPLQGAITIGDKMFMSYSTFNCLKKEDYSITNWMA